MFFDTMKIAWEYEPQGYLVGAMAYLPDFWLSGMRQWVEVKGSVLNLRERMIMAKAVLPRAGLPDNKNGILLLGGIPDVRVSGVKVSHGRFLFHQGGLYRNPFYFSEKNFDRPEWLIAPEIEHRSDAHLSKELGKNLSAWNPAGYIEDNYVEGYGRRKSSAAERRVDKAYVAARSARFEHGERG